MYLTGTEKFIEYTFSYSEQWRYKGSVKLRQPLISKEGANLSEQSNNKRIVLVKNSPLFGGLFLLEEMQSEKRERNKEGGTKWKNYYLHRNLLQRDIRIRSVMRFQMRSWML